MRYIRRIIPIAAALLCLLIYAVPVLLYARKASEKNLPLLLGGALGVFLAGDIAGLLLNNYLLKKLPPERYRRLAYLTAAVFVLLLIIAAVILLLRFGSQQGII